MVAPSSPPQYRCFVGIDVAATSFTAIWTTDGRMHPKAVTFSQSPAGFAAFQQQLQTTGVMPAQTLIVLVMLQPHGQYTDRLQMT